MDTQHMDTIYVEATVNRTVELRTIDKNEPYLNVLTPREAMQLAWALNNAAMEAMEYIANSEEP